MRFNEICERVTIWRRHVLDNIVVDSENLYFPVTTKTHFAYEDALNGFIITFITALILRVNLATLCVPSERRVTISTVKNEEDGNPKN